ncbi:MAG: right-handed parallel beta-helix repeat-containing protein, partial [Planctomycetota bacterium]
MKKTAILSVSVAFFFPFTGAASARVIKVPLQYASIQEAIDAGITGDAVVVSPGTYGSVNFNGKALTVRSIDPNDPSIVAATIIDAAGSGSAVTFANVEGRGSVLAGFTITGGTGTKPGVSYLGGGIYCRGASPTIAQNVIVGNSLLNDGGGCDGGGFCAGYGGNPLLYENVITNNYASRGGGIYASVVVEVRNNLICHNTAGVGGGLYVREEGCVVANNMVYSNAATLAEGGGVYLRGAPNATVRGNTIVDNYSGIDGANLDIQFSDNVAVVNNIIANGLNGAGVYFSYSASVDFKYNNVWNNAGGDYVGLPDQTGIQGNISADPLLTNPAADDYHLQAASPCIDSGDPNFVAGPDETDIDDQPRVAGSWVDIGADEYVDYVKPVANSGPDQYLDEIQIVTLDGSESFFHDPNGTKIFQWTQIAGPPVTLSDPCAAQPTFMPVLEAEYSFELVVGDGLNFSSPDTVLIVVGNRSPVAIAGPNAVCYVGQPAYLDGRDSYDPDLSDELIYFWRQLQGPNVVLYDANTPMPHFDCNQEGIYAFELVVSDGFDQSEPSVVKVVTAAFQIEQQDLDFTIQERNHFGDVSGNRVVFAHGAASPRGWDIECKDLETGQIFGFGCDTDEHRIDAHPRIEGDIVVWFGGDPDRPSEVYVRNITTAIQKPLKKSASRSYLHPAISGTKVVCVEHFDLDPADPFNASPFNICGADISNLTATTYFTVAENVGTAVGVYCYGCYAYDFDHRVDISGNLVVWEAQGDIHGADISDLNDIQVFAICTDPARQSDPAISGNIVVWTDERNDEGDIYGADISDTENIRVFEIVRQPGGQKEPAIDGCVIVYVDVTDGVYRGWIKACCLTKNYGAIDIELSGSPHGMGPAIGGEKIVWQDGYYGYAHGISLGVAYSIADGTIENLTAAKRYDYLQHAVNQAVDGDEIVLRPGLYRESFSFDGKPLTVRSVDPDDAAVVAGTVIHGDRLKPVVSVCNVYPEPPCVLTGLTITGGAKGIYCTGACPIIKKCNVVENHGAGIEWWAWPGCRYPMISNCTIAANQGSGIDFQGRTNPSIINCLAAGNGGYGIYARSPKLVNCTVVGNTLSGLSCLGGTVSNCIIRDNEDSEIQGSPIVRHSNIQGGWAGVGNMDADPCFVQPGHWDSNGGWTDGDYHLGVGSPCVDAGDNGCLPPDTTDLDGDANTAECIPWDLGCNLRMVDGDNDGNCVVDIGAHEFFLPPIEVAMKLTPSSLNPASEGNWIKLHFVLPEGYGVEDVDVSKPAECRLMDTGEMIESEYVNVFVNEEGLVEVEAAFDRSAFSLCLSQPAERIVSVIGLLAGAGGQDFYGTDTIKIINKALDQIAALASYWLTESCGEP